MASDGLLDVQGAIYETLKSINPSLCDGRIFDYVKDDVDFPFIRIGDSTAQPADVDGYSGTEEYLDIRVFSQAHGKKELKEITGPIKNALHRIHIDLGHLTAQCWWYDTKIIPDEDGVSMQAIMTFRILSFQSE